MRVTLDAAATTAAIRRLMEAKRAEVNDAARRTVNILAMKGARAVQAEMRQVFDRPTRYAINSVKWTEDLPGPAAEVQFREGDDWRTANQGYLKAQIYGGPRPQKASERRIQRMRMGGQDIYLVPTAFAELDAYGNISRGQMVRILSSLQVLGGAGEGFDGNRSQSRRSRRSARGHEYFAIWPGSEGRQRPGGRVLPPAIYRKFGVGASAYIRPVLIFAKKAPVYKQRLNPTATVARVVAQEAAAVWADRLTKALTRSTMA